MSNFYTDSPALSHYLHHPLMRRICELNEHLYRNECVGEPADYDDAMNHYERVLTQTGELCAETIAPNAESVDREGPSVVDGRVVYAAGTQADLDAMRRAGLMGVSMPRRLGGLNLPVIAYMIAADMISRADASFENIWGLQSCAETIRAFGSEEQREHFVRRACAGETMSMDLTEPCAGSDLQSVKLSATFDEGESCWRLNGVKRFVTNGDADIHLVLARSEVGSTDGRGLSMFIYDRRDGGVSVSRIESKMGIKGSPTCELRFENARAELCGNRRLGLIKYVMALVNGARLGIAAQSVGISDAAVREAETYAAERCQFGRPIGRFPAVADIIATMRAKLDASRSLLYQTARCADIAKALDDLSRERSLTPEECAEQIHYARLADSLTPIAKALGSEYANQNAYDCIQVHGGSGFMSGCTSERLYRDARITSIYEGTTQMQVVAAIRHVTSGGYSETIRNYDALTYPDPLRPLQRRLRAMTSDFELSTQKIAAFDNREMVDLSAHRLVEMAGTIIMGYLLLSDATRSEALFRRSAEIYVRYAEAECAKHAKYINSLSTDFLEVVEKQDF